MVPKRVARVAKQFTARTIGGVTFFVEDDLENDVEVIGLFSYQVLLSTYTVNDGNRERKRDDGVVDH